MPSHINKRAENESWATKHLATVHLAYFVTYIHTYIHTYTKRRYIAAKPQEQQVLANSVIDGRTSDKHDDCVKNIWRTAIIIIPKCCAIYSPSIDMSSFFVQCL